MWLDNLVMPLVSIPTITVPNPTFTTGELVDAYNKAEFEYTQNTYTP